MLIETLTSGETRVLGALVEKSLATPDYYPLTLNSLRTACNQKSSRDPVTDYDDEAVSLALAGLKRKCLAAFIPYGSQGNLFKYRHFLEDVRFNLRKPDLAVLAVLLLRGSQTLNEVRTRAASLHPVGGLEETEAILKGLAGRPEPLAALLPKRSGWKEPRWQDTVGDHSDGHSDDHHDDHTGKQEGNQSGHDGESPTDAQGAVHAPGHPLAGLSAARGDAGGSRKEDIEELKREVAELKATVSDLKDMVEKIRSELY